ncbi:MAG: complex I NDUFA9 subunit family protein [Deltaproteobacteria bacterium]|nr:MAG: complex I NDUFA9 subunit family protein [Deltaproteobacteria bacterium]
MKILVAGGTGFIGSAVVRQADAAGHRVACLSRGVHPGCHPRGVLVFKVDLVRPQGLDRALAGVDAVVHAVGILRETKGQSFERVHVGGTANLIDACKRAGVSKIVYISSLGAHLNRRNTYLRTKAEAEHLIQGSGIPYTILRPSLVFGAGDRLVTHILWWMRGSRVVPILSHHGVPVQPIWVGDVATAAIRALGDPGTDGQIYDLGGPAQMTYADMVKLIKQRTGLAAIALPIPAVLSQSIGRLGQRLFERPPLSSDQLELLVSGGTCDPSPAAVTFGLRMRSLADVLPEYRQPS